MAWRASKSTRWALPSRFVPCSPLPRWLTPRMADLFKPPTLSPSPAHTHRVRTQTCTNRVCTAQARVAALSSDVAALVDSFRLLPRPLQGTALNALMTPAQASSARIVSVGPRGERTEFERAAVRAEPGDDEARTARTVSAPLKEELESKSTAGRHEL